VYVYINSRRPENISSATSNNSTYESGRYLRLKRAVIINANGKGDERDLLRLLVRRDLSSPELDIYLSSVFLPFPLLSLSLSLSPLFLSLSFNFELFPGLYCSVKRSRQSPMRLLLEHRRVDLAIKFRVPKSSSPWFVDGPGARTRSAEWTRGKSCSSSRWLNSSSETPEHDAGASRANVKITRTKWRLLH